MHRLEPCPVAVKGGNASGGAFDFLGVHSCRQVPVELLEVLVADGPFGDPVAHLCVVPENHQVDELVLQFRELFAQRLDVPEVLVVRILHRELLFAPAHDDSPLLVIGLADNQSDVRLLLYDEDALLGYGDDVYLLDSVAPVHVDVFEDNPLACGLDVVCRIVLADMPDNLVLEEPYAKDNRTEDDYKRYHAIVLLKI